MWNFIQGFFDKYESRNYTGNPFFIFGESYAGHYVPAVSAKIVKELASGTAKHQFNYQGSGIGNGLTDPEIQYKYYPEMAVSTNDHKPAIGKAEAALMEAAVGPCVEAIHGCQTNSSDCLVATEVCNAGLLIPYQLTGLNPYVSALTDAPSLYG